MKALPLTLAMALEVAANLGPKDREEIAALWPDLNAWARSRVNGNGASWGLVADGRTVGCGGVIFEGTTATLWIAGRAGWLRHVKQVLRIWREIAAGAKDLAIERFRCRVCIDNARAQRFVERLGFRRQVPAGGYVPYELEAA